MNEALRLMLETALEEQGGQDSAACSWVLGGEGAKASQREIASGFGAVARWKGIPCSFVPVPVPRVITCVSVKITSVVADGKSR